MAEEEYTIGKTETLFREVKYRGKKEVYSPLEFDNGKTGFYTIDEYVERLRRRLDIEREAGKPFPQEMHGVKIHRKGNGGSKCWPGGKWQ